MHRRAGSHAFYITDRNLNQTGTYTFSLLRVNPPTTAQPLAYGDTKTGARDAAVKIDVWSFTGAVGDRIFLRLTSTFLPTVYLRRPDGTQLSGCATDNSVSGNLQLECTLDRAGSYAFYITDRNLNQTGTYTFSLLRVNPPTTAQPLAYGDTKIHTAAPWRRYVVPCRWQKAIPAPVVKAAIPLKAKQTAGGCPSYHSLFAVASRIFICFCH